MKSQKGMSYITLIVIIIVLAFVIAIATHFIKVMIENKKFETFETNMLQIQGKVKILQQEALMANDEGKFQGRKLSNFEEIEEVKKLMEASVISKEEENYDKYYIIDNYDIENMKLEGIKIDEGFFIVNYSNEEVIYSEGVTKADKTYYKLADIRNAGKEEEKENSENSEETTSEETEGENQTEETSDEESNEETEEEAEE